MGEAKRKKEAAFAANIVDGVAPGCVSMTTNAMQNIPIYVNEVIAVVEVGKGPGKAAVGVSVILAAIPPSDPAAAEHPNTAACIAITLTGTLWEEVKNILNGNLPERFITAAEGEQSAVMGEIKTMADIAAGTRKAH